MESKQYEREWHQPTPSETSRLEGLLAETKGKSSLVRDDLLVQRAYSLAAMVDLVITEQESWRDYDHGFRDGYQAALRERSVEVMPASEHEALRGAAQAVVDAVRPGWSPEVDALQFMLVTLDGGHE